jgi:hypothetical protein
MRVYRILQLLVFDSCPFTLTAPCSADAGIQGILPSILTLIIRSTQYERGNCSPICLVLFATPLLGSIRNCTSQLCIFF